MIARGLEPHLSTLERVASLCAQAEEKAREGGESIPYRPQEAGAVVIAASKDSAEALALLETLGVEPSRAARPRPAPVNPLAELTRLERSRVQALALLVALRAALPAAEALDEARGDVLDTPVLGSRGLVWGEDLVQMIAKLELEVYGPGGAVTGGRE